ncbi:hypothetical protein GCM10020331_044790 [Ectobacillus funiculus]
MNSFFIEKIQSTYPNHRVLGEEGYGDDITSSDGTVWLIDPIDGTMNFVHQKRNFAISIGVYHDGVGKIGLVYDPVHDELYHALEGEGAYCNGIEIPKLEPGSVSEGVVAVNATWLTENRRLDHRKMAELVRRARGTRSYGCAALEIVYVATGRLDAYITPRLSPWDFWRRCGHCTRGRWNHYHVCWRATRPSGSKQRISGEARRLRASN